MQLKVNIIDNWNDVTLRDFFSMEKILKDESLNDFDKDLQLLELLSSLKMEEIQSLPLRELKPLLRSISFLTKDVPVITVREVYEVQGRKYRLQASIPELTGYQVTDIFQFLNDPEKIPNNRHLILAVLMQPLNKDGMPESYLETTSFDDIKADMLLLTMPEVIGIENFFTMISEAFAATSVSSIRMQIMEQLKSVLKMLQEKEILNPTEKELLTQIPVLLKDGDFSQ